MRYSKYQKHLVYTIAYTKRIMEATKGIGKKYIKVATKDCFIFDSRFYSKKLG